RPKQIFFIETICPTHGLPADAWLHREQALAGGQQRCYIRFARNEDKLARAIRHGRIYWYPIMLVLSIYGRRQRPPSGSRTSKGKPAMPILEAFGPGLDRSLPATGGGAARRFPSVQMPSLEWNATVERQTARLYERIKTVIPSVEW